MLVMVPVACSWWEARQGVCQAVVKEQEKILESSSVIGLCKHCHTKETSVSWIPFNGMGTKGEKSDPPPVDSDSKQTTVRLGHAEW
jgi:hypothetical protein